LHQVFDFLDLNGKNGTKSGSKQIKLGSWGVGELGNWEKNFNNP